MSMSWMSNGKHVIHYWDNFFKDNYFYSCARFLNIDVSFLQGKEKGEGEGRIMEKVGEVGNQQEKQILTNKSFSVRMKEWEERCLLHLNYIY